MSSAESDRLAEARSGAADWRRWGTYLSERAWGTVREDYSADGDAWGYFPFEQARSRAYRWNEDGLAGWCDRDQTICIGLALWNERDAILKERPFGLANEQGNHGEDVKDYWFYTDNLPAHTYASMVYKYPQVAFPYEDLLRTNAQRSQAESEYELFDALREDWLANRYFDVQVEYAKSTPEDVYCRITVTNRGTQAAPIHVIPQIWYRNTWDWELDAVAPMISLLRPGVAFTTHADIGDRWIFVKSDGGSTPEFLFCNNESNAHLLFGSKNTSAHVKDGINDRIVEGRLSATNSSAGSKLGLHVKDVIAAGESLTVTVHFATADLQLPFDDADEVFDSRKVEADEFYAEFANPSLTADERLVQRQALAGLLWCKQFYHYAVRRWLEGDPTQPVPPAERWQGRNVEWQHLINKDVILMPDAWEYPWYAAWDLAFHCVALATIDPDLAKEQVLLLLSSFCQHPHGQIPAYEWEFSDTNPPVHAWATWQVYQLDRQAKGHGDDEFLKAAYRSITLDVMWWLNQKDDKNRGVFGGGFLGMDNIGVFDRDQPLPTGGNLAQIDGTSWMATLVLQMLEITVELASIDTGYDRMFGRWVWDGWLIATAIERGAGNISFWNEDTNFYHDVIELPDGSAHSLEVFSMQSMVPLFASFAIPLSAEGELRHISERMRVLVEAYGGPAVSLRANGGDNTHLLIALVGEDRLALMLQRLTDPEQFLSSYGVRSLSKQHRDQPYTYHANGQAYEVAYMPAESSTRMFGGNSNWRGPIWFPMNFFLLQSLNAYARFFGDTFTLPDPNGSGLEVTLAELGDLIAGRLSSIFVRDASGRRAVFGANDYFQTDPHWRDLVPFYEYFDGDDGHGLGASHQTGWTSLVALLLQRGGDLRFTDFSR